MNEAVKYGVRIVPAVTNQWYWKAIKVRHLTGAENHGQHNVFINALDENGNRVLGGWAGWTWEGRRPTERADPIALDKPPSDFAMGNVAIHWGQVVSVWMIGSNRVLPEISDKVENLHTMHPDEEAGNTRGHHSFEVTFQWTREGSTPLPPIPGEEYKTFELAVSQGDDIEVDLKIRVKRW